MPDYTYEEIARMKREAYDEGYKAGYESRLEEELHPKKNQSYEPQGRAAEYSPLAANLYTGCDHRCEYCYAPAALRTTKEKHAVPKLRKDMIANLRKDADKLEKTGDKRQILLCFSCDPYQKFDVDHGLTREALKILLSGNLNVAVLTKGGKRSERDFDLLAAYKAYIKYGATLVFADDAEALHREPGAAPTSERIQPASAAAGSQEDRIEPPSRESAAPLEERLECPPGLKGLGSAGSVQKAPEISAARQDRIEPPSRESALLVECDKYI